MTRDLERCIDGLSIAPETVTADRVHDGAAPHRATAFEEDGSYYIVGRDGVLAADDDFVTAFESFIADLAPPYGTLFLQEGTYRLSRPLEITAPVTVRGAQVGTYYDHGFTSLELSDGVDDDAVRIAANNVHLYDICVEANKENNAAGDGIVVAPDAYHPRLSRVCVLNAAGTGIRVAAGGTLMGAYLSNCYAEYCEDNAYRIGNDHGYYEYLLQVESGRDGILADGSRNVFVGCHSSAAARRNWEIQSTASLYVGCGANDAGAEAVGLCNGGNNVLQSWWIARPSRADVETPAHPAIRVEDEGNQVCNIQVYADAPGEYTHAVASDGGDYNAYDVITSRHHADAAVTGLGPHSQTGITVEHRAE